VFSTEKTDAHRNYNILFHYENQFKYFQC